MLYAAYILLGLFSVLNLISVTCDKKKLEFISKPLLIPLIIVIYCLSVKEFDYVVIAGLLFGWLGDVFLLFDKESCFKGGLISFLIGHIFYVAAFLGETKFSDINFIITVLIAGVYILYIFAVSKKLIPSVDTKFKGAVIAYITVIMLMSMTALLRFETVGINGVLSYTGSLFFVASDSILAFKVFAEKRGKMINFLIMFTYITAQFMIAFGMI